MKVDIHRVPRFSQVVRTLSSLLLVMFVISSYSQPVRFYSSDREISNSMITKILQDKQGFIWIATEDGLNRFDGLTFKCYRSIHNDSTTLTSNFVRTLGVDRAGRLWVGCINGLLQYNPQDESFREIKLYRDTIQLQPHVSSILESKNGDMLIGTSGHGLVVIKKGADKGYVDLELAPRLSSEFLDCMFEDSTGKLWIGSVNEGINLFDPATRQVRIFRQNPGQPNSLSSNYISDICEDKSGNIFIGTLNGGLNQYVQKTGSFKIFPCKSEKKIILPVKIFSLTVRKIFG
jgi:ligand-binding sensor domain-containing protein